MNKSRLEAFSDGVIAIIITIMVLTLNVPHGTDFAALRPLVPVFLTYILSFIYTGIYWNNHHHLFQAVRQVNGRVLWANLHLLFWLSFIPFVTGWVGQSHFAAVPVFLYGIVFLFAALAYLILSRSLITHNGRNSTLAVAVGADFKGKISIGFYVAGILLAFVVSWVAYLFYVFVAVLWLIPDRRIERVFNSQKQELFK
ncbi:hypothetical protein LEP3755_35130 [Leptolyngbya sp. NIES-3755]|nr:hypothetical protein LEP3755_35130 [Leptolyngbya sp. NIES-3755]